MFEKEAKERAKDYTDNAKRQVAYECGFLDGVDLGYNKANEWHYVKDGKKDLPRNNTEVLVLLENKRLKISIFMENVFTIWNKDYDAYTKLYGVIAWKEIVLPELKEIKEND